MGCCPEYRTSTHSILILGDCLHLPSLLPQHSSALLHYLCLEQAKPEHAAFLLGLFLQRHVHSLHSDSILAVGGLADHRAVDRHRHRPSVLLLQPGKREDDEFEAVYDAAFPVSEGGEIDGQAEIAVDSGIEAASKGGRIRVSKKVARKRISVGDEYVMGLCNVHWLVCGLFV